MGNIDDIAAVLANGLPVAKGQFSNALMSAAGTYTIIKSTGGLLHSIFIGMNSCPSMSIYDNRSGISGTLVANITAGMPPGNYVVDFTVLNGISIDCAVGNAPAIRFDYKS